jgi:hypothetical protein
MDAEAGKTVQDATRGWRFDWLSALVALLEPQARHRPSHCSAMNNQFLFWSFNIESLKGSIWSTQS